MFIELTHSIKGEKVFINLRDIATILPLENGKTRLSHMSNGEEVVFLETYEQVKEMIKLEVAAERGY